MSTEAQKPQGETGATTPAVNGTTSAAGDKKLTNAELKKKQKEEKQAKRAAQKREAGVTIEPNKPAPESSKVQQAQNQKKPSSPKSQPEKQQKSDQTQQKGNMPRRGSSSQPKAAKTVGPVKRVGLFGHLYGQPRRHTISGASKDIHPAILALGLQMSSYEICGSNARCVAMLLAFKHVIRSYATPHGTSLARHLTSHHLSPQIEYLKSCRPISVNMGNAIRWLKDLIIKIDPDVPESEAKESLIEAIDGFIQERITAADTLISEIASNKIVDGDVIVTYANSSIVRKTLLEAHVKGKRFKVVVVDSNPLYEGRRLADELEASGVEVEYSHVSAAASAMEDATRVFLGAHAMMANGCLYSRVGTAVVAMLAHSRGLPVLVCCESIKFTERVALDSIVTNEVSPAEELLARDQEGDAQIKRWNEAPNLQLLNIMYDVTPADYIKMVVTEYGNLPPSSVPAVLRNLGTI